MIELVDVVKRYRAGPLVGRREAVTALDGITLRIPPGSALGIVGLNGAGKSTLIRILLGYARPTSGSATIDGLLPRAYVEAKGVAYVPERATFPGGWTVRNALGTFAMLADAPGDPWAAVERAIDRLGLTHLANRRLRSLSKGNVQRVAIAQAILVDRSIMVLDEPTDGLDPVWIAELRAVLSEWRSADPRRILVIASHTLAEVERLADSVLLLHNGRIEGDLSPSGHVPLEERFLARVSELPAPR